MEKAFHRWYHQLLRQFYSQHHWNSTQYQLLWWFPRVLRSWWKWKIGLNNRPSTWVHTCHTFIFKVFGIFCKLDAFLDIKWCTWPDTAATERQPNDREDDESHNMRRHDQNCLCFCLSVVITIEHGFNFLCGKVAILGQISVACWYFTLSIVSGRIWTNWNSIGISICGDMSLWNCESGLRAG